MSSSLVFKEHFDLKNYNTMGVRASARYFTEISSDEQLNEAFTFSSEKQVPILVLGGGSNLLFVEDFEGLVLQNSIKGITILEENEDQIFLKVGAGENWDNLVQYAVKNGYGGIENLSLIPGTVGAAPIQNIGAYGVELKDCFVSLEGFQVETKKIIKFDADECKFGYRDSVFKRELKGKVVITSVSLSLQKNSVVNVEYSALKQRLSEKGIGTPTIRDVSETVIEVRQSKLPDPAVIGNTGSFFKNPEIPIQQFEELKETYSSIPGYVISEESMKVPAGWLIEQAGWKGKRVGEAGVHEKQALVLVNHGEATGKEIWSLAKQIQSSVIEKFGIALVPEVNVIGSF